MSHLVLQIVSLRLIFHTVIPFSVILWSYRFSVGVLQKTFHAMILDKIKGTVIAEDFPVEVDGEVAEHNSLLQCPKSTGVV